MIIVEDYLTRKDGIKLIRRYSDKHLMLLQTDTGTEYAEAIDVENTPHIYEETENPITEDVLTAEQALDILMGGDGNGGADS